MTNNKPIRSYCHPVDAKIIKVLDNPAIISIVKKYVDFATDVNLGTMIASAVPVSEKNMPWIYEMVVDCANTLNIPVPHVLISGGVGMNAFATGTDEKPFIVLGNSLVKAMEKNKNYLRFVIGHECGHIAMGHMVYNNLVNIISNAALMNMNHNSALFLTPMLKLALYAWSRRSEISADRAGLLCCGDLDAAQHALVQLEMGFLNMDSIDIEDYLSGSDMYVNGTFVRRFGEYMQVHPILPKRVKALRMFAESSLIYRLVGLTPPDFAVSDKEMESEVERLVNVAKKAKVNSYCDLASA